MADDDVTVVGGRVPAFSGDEKDFQMWWQRFKSYAKVKGFIKGLKRNVNLPKSEEEAEKLDLSNSEDKKKIAAVTCNNVALAQLSMAFQTETLMHKIFLSQSKDWPEGLAIEVVEDLLLEYQPQDRISRVEMRRRLARVRMGRSKIPKCSLNKLQLLKMYSTQPQTR